jgi:hypothetical protein
MHTHAYAEGMRVSGSVSECSGDNDSRMHTHAYTEGTRVSGSTGMVSELFDTLTQRYTAERMAHSMPVMAVHRLLPTLGAAGEALIISPCVDVADAGFGGEPPPGAAARAIARLHAHCEAFARLHAALARVEDPRRAPPPPDRSAWEARDPADLIYLADAVDAQLHAATYFMRDTIPVVYAAGLWDSPIVAAAASVDAMDRMLALLVTSRGVTTSRSDDERLFHICPIAALAAAYLRLHYVAGGSIDLPRGLAATGVASPVPPSVDGPVVRAPSYAAAVSGRGGTACGTRSGFAPFATPWDGSPGVTRMAWGARGLATHGWWRRARPRNITPSATVSQPPPYGPGSPPSAYADW